MQPNPHQRQDLLLAMGKPHPHSGIGRVSLRSCPVGFPSGQTIFASHTRARV
jgi:hypothetical protein